MPIIVENYTFEQTLDQLVISVPLRGVSSAKVDIYSTDLYLKANYPPFLFELDLMDYVDSNQSRVVIGDGYIRFHLQKKVASVWPRVDYDTVSNSDVTQRRLASNIPSSDSTTLDQSKKWMEHQMKVETKARNLIKEIKQNEHDEAVVYFYTSLHNQVREWIQEQQAETNKHEKDQTLIESNIGKMIRKGGKIVTAFTPISSTTNDDNASDKCRVDLLQLPMRTRE